jgi:PAS domain S-box-containing protein
MACVECEESSRSRLLIGGKNGRRFTAEDRAIQEAEAERRQALAHGRAEDERWHVRKDGSRFWGSGLLIPLGDRQAGFVKIMRDLTERRTAYERLEASEELFRVLATNIPQLVFRSRGDGSRTWPSPQWIIYTGQSFDESLGFGWLDAIHPGDREKTLRAWEEAQATRQYHMEHRVRRSPDNEYRWHQTRAALVKEGPAELAEWVGTSTDVHDLHQLQERQSLLLAELQHRTRNLLGVVQAIARQTQRTTGSMAEFGREFESRLRALSRVQGLLAREKTEPIELRELLDAELSAHGHHNSGKVTIEGPSAALSASGAQTLALALDELTTNAIKHGAFQHPLGRVTVSWRVEGEQGPRHLVLEWRETGVPMSSAAARRVGFGTELILRGLPHQLEAETSLTFEPDGVWCLIVLPANTGARQDV